PAIEWISQNRQYRRLRGGIASAAALWSDISRSYDRLVGGRLVRAAGVLLENSAHFLGPAEREFVEVSQQKDKEGRHRRIVRSCWLALAIVAAVLLPAIGLKRLENVAFVSRALVTIWSSDLPIPASQSARTNLNNNIQTLAL